MQPSSLILVGLLTLLATTTTTATATTNSLITNVKDLPSLTSYCKPLPYDASKHGGESLPILNYRERFYTHMSPMTPPAYLLDYYTRCGQLHYVNHYVDSSSLYRHDKMNFVKEEVEKVVEMAKADLKAVSGRKESRDDEVLVVLSRQSFANKRVVVFGSDELYYEGVALSLGAEMVVSVEHCNMTVESDKIKLKKLDKLEAEAAEPSFVKFDVALAISTFNHDGLGRYGDPLSPDGDLLSMRTVKSVLKPNGKLFLTVPIGPDTIGWNIQRRYGPKRLSMLLDGWKVLHKSHFDEYKFNLDLNQVDMNSTEVPYMNQPHEAVFVLEPVV